MSNIRLTPKEKDTLRDKIKERRISTSVLALVIGVKPETMSRILNEDVGLNPKNASRLYALLGEELEFLKDIADKKTPVLQPYREGDVWMSRYDAFEYRAIATLGKLEDKERLEALKELEEIVSKYQQATAHV